MEPHELHQHAEHARDSGQRGIGLTTAIVAVFLAAATMLGNRTHVIGGELETQIDDQWTAYNSKHSLTHTFTADTQQAELSGKIGDILATHLNMTRAEKAKAIAEIKATAQAQADQYRASGAAEDKESLEIKRHAQQMERQVDALTHSGDIYNLSELFLQLSIVLCSIALLSESRLFWKVSFLTTLAGAGLIVYGLVR